MKTDIETWKKAFSEIRADWNNQQTKTGDAAFAALERRLPGLEQMWYDLRDFEQRIRAVEDKMAHLVLQRNCIPVDCVALSGACDARHRPHGSAAANRR